MDISLLLYRHDDGTTLFKGKVSSFSPKPIQIGQKACIQIISYRSEEPFPENVLLEYDLVFQSKDGEKSVAASLPELLYPGQRGIVFTFKPKVDHHLKWFQSSPSLPLKKGREKMDDAPKSYQ